MIPYPLTFRPILKSRIWGGRRLRRLGKPLPEGEMIGESWELADLPEPIEGGRSVIAHGPLEGMTLREAIALDRDAFMGEVALEEDGGFPLLLKYLDARENLSVQVHPDAAYARSHPGALLKSEAWVVIDAERGAVIYKGLRAGVTAASIRESIADGTAADDLIAVPAVAGDCHYLPSGTCHALGAGVMVAEVQTASDTTFRLYDWGRQGRELHIEEALECITFGAAQAIPPTTHGTGTIDSPRRLCATEHFVIESFEAAAEQSLRIAGEGRPVVWMVLAGGGTMRMTQSLQTDFAAGSTILLPAGLNGAWVVFDRNSSVLRITVPAREP